MALRVRTHDRLAEIAAADWDALDARPPASLSGSRAWLEAALATVDRDVSLNLIGMERDGRLVGLIPLVRDERPLRPVLRFAAAPHNDLADAMTLPGHGPEVGRAAIAALQDHAASGCAIRLEELDPAGVLAAADRDRRLLRWSPGSAAPIVDLRDRGAGPSRKRRRDWDRSLRRLRAGHRVEFRCLRGAVAIEVLPRFVRQRNLRLRALKRSFVMPPPALLEAAVRALAPLGRCALAEMTVDGIAVARDLYLLHGEVAMLWLRALDMAWLQHSCGHLLLRATAERFAAAGYEILDLGRGAEPYKFDFGAMDRELLNASLEPNARR